MNRNVESHFSMLPSAEIKRSRFDRSQDVKFTCNVSELIPFYVDEVLPGDTFDVTTSKVIRLQTLLTPVMDNMYADFYYFFVPNRLVWDHWQNFMGESEKAWLPEVQYAVPKIGLIDDTAEGDGAVQVGDILDYMGVPVGVSCASDSGVLPADKFSGVNALPYRAYLKIYNDWFRDENLVDPINIYTGDNNYKYKGITTPHKPLKAAKFHDYFTSCLPNRAKLAGAGEPFQSGSVVSPVYGYNTQAIPVITGTANRAWQSGDTYPALHGHSQDGTTIATGQYAAFGEARNTADDGTTRVVARNTNGTGTYAFVPDNLYVDLSAHPMIGGIDIVSLRYAFQVQKFYEALARSGSRYIEILAGLFGVHSPDQRLQRAEYLGGNRIPVTIHQVTNQSQGESDFLGDVGAMSLTTDKHSDFVKSFVEHGFVIGIMTIRYDHSYPQGLERFWFRRDRFDYYWPQFANLSEQPVYVGELRMSADNLAGEEVFGFQEAWADYRYKPNKTMAEMRPGISNTLASWHFADYYTQRPYLSQEWIEEDKANVDRTLAVTSELANQVLCDIYIQNYSTRPMPLYSIPGLADHH